MNIVIRWLRVRRWYDDDPPPKIVTSLPYEVWHKSIWGEVDLDPRIAMELITLVDEKVCHE